MALPRGLKREATVVATSLSERENQLEASLAGRLTKKGWQCRKESGQRRVVKGE